MNARAWICVKVCLFLTISTQVYAFGNIMQSRVHFEDQFSDIKDPSKSVFTNGAVTNKVIVKTESSTNAQTFGQTEKTGYDHQISGMSDKFFNPSMTCDAEPLSNAAINFQWIPVEVGQTSTTKKLCLQPNGMPLTRKCFWNADKRPSWGNYSQNAKCITRTREPLITNHLYSLLGSIDQRKRSGVQVIQDLKGTFKQKHKLIPADVHLVSRIVQKITRTPNPNICLNLLGVYKQLMKADEEVLRVSTELNSTNILLESLENCMDSAPTLNQKLTFSAEEQFENLYIPTIGVQGYLSAELSVFYIDSSAANVSGIAIYPSPLVATNPDILLKSFGDFYYRFLFANETVKNLLQNNKLQFATFVPQEMWRNLTILKQQSELLVIKIYTNSAFFVESRLFTTRKVTSRIVSLRIPGTTGWFDGMIPMIFNAQKTRLFADHIYTGCGYWNYDTWAEDGIEIIEEQWEGNDLIACGSHHLTQFAYLVGGEYRYPDLSGAVIITKLHVKALNIITLVGCSLSILGLIAIYITSFAFKSWRAKASTKILLHFCSAILLQMMLFCFVNTHDMTVHLLDNREYAGCIIIGALLHYAVLVEFAWMFIIAFFQFQRYVQVLGTKPKRFILKSALVAWSVPTIPPILLIAIDRRSYIPSTEHNGGIICYPSGNGLNFAVILPLLVIIMANLIIFLMVFWSIRHTMEIASKVNVKKKLYQEIRLMTMMFFLFGLTWIFGLMAAAEAGLIFSYLFCITATLQGFILFVYFVVMDPLARKLWQQTCCGAEDKLRNSEEARLRSSL